MGFVDIATGTVKMDEPDSVEYTEVTQGDSKVGVTVRTVKRGDRDWDEVLQSWAFRQGYVKEGEGE